MSNTPLAQYEALTNTAKFIGANPITLQRKHLKNINAREYAVKEKADGERFLVFVPETSEGETPYCYFIDRGMNFTRIPFIRTDFAGTIIDVEYIKARDTCFGFDALCFKGEDLRGNPDYPLQARLAHLNTFVAAVQQHATSDMPTFIVMDFFFDNVWQAAQQLVQKIEAPGQQHDTDGLIFIPQAEPYPTTKLWENVYKWKPSEFNSIDFLLHKAHQYDDHAVWHLLSRRKQDGSVFFEPFSPPGHPEIYIMPLPNGYADEVGVPFEEGMVAECVYDEAKGQFFPFRHRPDKNEDKRCNSLTTALDVWETIIHPVTQAMIMAQVD